MMFQIGQSYPIVICRREACFDRACDEAYQHALRMFGCDDAGHLNDVKDSDRSQDTVVVEFVRYYRTGDMGGQSHEYLFEAKVIRDDEDDDND